MLIYIIRNLVNHKVYIGQHVGTNLFARWRGHVRQAKLGSRFVIHNAIRKYGAQAFEITALSTYASSQADLDAQEIFYIYKYRAIDRKYGYNMLVGGAGFRNHKPWNTGLKLSAELCKKLSESHKGFKPSRESIQKQALAMRGRRASEETKQRMRKPKSEQARENMRAAQRRRTKHGMSGKTHSKETRQAQSAAAKGKPKSEAHKAALKLAWEKRKQTGKGTTDQPRISGRFIKNN